MYYILSDETQRGALPRGQCLEMKTKKNHSSERGQNPQPLFLKYMNIYMDISAQGIREAVGRGDRAERAPPPPARTRAR